MEKDTVILDVKTYNNLRDYKQKHFNNEIYTLVSNRSGDKMVFYTESKALELLNKELESSKSLAQSYFEKIQDLSKELMFLRDKCPQPKIVGLEDIKKMSYWEFRKWKKSNL